VNGWSVFETEVAEMPEVLIFNIKGAVRIGLISFTSAASTSGSAPEDEESK